MNNFFKVLLALFENDAKIAADKIVASLKDNKATYLANLAKSGESASSFLENLVIAHLKNDPRVSSFAEVVQPLISGFIAEESPALDGDVGALYDAIVAWLVEEEKYIP